MRKKLLILGGTAISRQILWTAKELGYDVHVTDYLEDSPCKKLADKSYCVSATDVDAVVNLIHDENIDGVLTGYADILLPYYVDICNKAKLPCYANDIAISIANDKSRFKQKCIEFEIPVVPEYSYDDVVNGTVTYPLIVKPVDNSGARGIYICTNRVEFDVNYQKALSFSKSKHILIERMMTGKEATIFYYIHDGKVYLLGIGDRWMHEQDAKHLKLPVGYTFPSNNIQLFMDSQNENIVRMFHSMGMKEGMVFMQTFIDNDRYVVYEMGYRLTGSIEQHLTEKEYKFNHLKQLIKYAVGDTVETEAVESLDPKKCCMANVTLLLTRGTISKLDGIEDVMKIPGVCHVYCSYNIGKTIDETIIGTLAQVGVRVLLTADSQEQLIYRMDQIKDKIHVYDQNGNDMVIRNYTYKTLCKG
jgi:biotin carboxylase